MTFKSCFRRTLAFAGALAVLGSSLPLTASAANSYSYMPETLLTRINVKSALTDADIALAMGEGLEAEVKRVLEDFVASQQTAPHNDKRFKTLSAGQLYVGKSFRVAGYEEGFIKDESVLSYPIYNNDSVYGILDVKKDTGGKLSLSVSYCTDALSMALKLSGTAVMVDSPYRENLQGLLAVTPRGHVYELSKTFEEGKEDVYYEMAIAEMPAFTLSESHLSPGIPTEASRSYKAAADTLEAQLVSEGLYHIKNLYSGLYLTYSKESKGLVQKELDGGNLGNQTFDIEHLFHTGQNFPPFDHEISLTATSDAAIKRSSALLGIPEDTYVKNGTRLLAGVERPMEFIFIPAGESSYCILTAKPSFFLKSASALEVAGASKSSGAPVQLWQYKNAANQKWVLEPAANK